MPATAGDRMNDGIREDLYTRIRPRETPEEIEPHEHPNLIGVRQTRCGSARVTMRGGLPSNLVESRRAWRLDVRYTERVHRNLGGSPRPICRLTRCVDCDFDDSYIEVLLYGVQVVECSLRERLSVTDVEREQVAHSSGRPGPFSSQWKTLEVRVAADDYRNRERLPLCAGNIDPTERVHCSRSYATTIAARFVRDAMPNRARAAVAVPQRDDRC